MLYVIYSLALKSYLTKNECPGSGQVIWLGGYLGHWALVAKWSPQAPVPPPFTHDKFLGSTTPLAAHAVYRTPKFI